MNTMINEQNWLLALLVFIFGGLGLASAIDEAGKGNWVAILVALSLATCILITILCLLLQFLCKDSPSSP